MAWTEQETLLLIDLWGEESVQVQIEGCARNKEVYAKLAARMQEEGYNRSGTQCREKIKKLRLTDEPRGRRKGAQLVVDP